MAPVLETFSLKAKKNPSNGETIVSLLRKKRYVLFSPVFLSCTDNQWTKNHLLDQQHCFFHRLNNRKDSRENSICLFFSQRKCSSSHFRAGNDVCAQTLMSANWSSFLYLIASVAQNSLIKLILKSQQDFFKKLGETNEYTLSKGKKKSHIFKNTWGTFLEHCFDPLVVIWRSLLSVINNCLSARCKRLRKYFDLRCSDLRFDFCTSSVELNTAYETEVERHDSCLKKF